MIRNGPTAARYSEGVTTVGTLNEMAPAIIDVPPSIQAMVKPPETLMVCPVMNGASSLTRNAIMPA